MAFSSGRDTKADRQERRDLDYYGMYRVQWITVIQNTLNALLSVTWDLLNTMDRKIVNVFLLLLTQGTECVSHIFSESVVSSVEDLLQVFLSSTWDWIFWFCVTMCAFNLAFILLHVLKIECNIVCKLFTDLINSWMGYCRYISSSWYCIIISGFSLISGTVFIRVNTQGVSIVCVCVHVCDW